MKKFKIAFWVILLALLGIIVYENKDFFLSYSPIIIVDLWFTKRAIAPVPIIVIMAGFFALGLVVAWIMGLAERLRTNRTIKELRNATKTDQSSLVNLQQQIDTLKRSGGIIDVPYDSGETQSPKS
jgi:hypothetical protein